MPRYAYIPFGTGSRASLEESVVLTAGKLILATLAQRYRFTAQSDETPAFEAGVTLRPKGSLMMRAAEAVAVL
jgi:cytochrome P450